MSKFFILLLFTSIFLSSNIMANEPITSNVEMKCGGVYEGEFSKNIERHEYNIKMAPGDKLDISTAPVGAYLGLRIDIYGPSKTVILRQRPTNKVRSCEARTTI